MKEDDVREFVNDHLTQCLKQLPERMRKIKGIDFPNLRHDNDYITVNTWDLVVSDEDILFLLKKHTDNISAYLKEKKTNIYALWRQGKVPVWVMRNYDLQEENLDKKDADRLKEENQNDAKLLAKATQQHQASADKRYG